MDEAQFLADIFFSTGLNRDQYVRTIATMYVRVLRTMPESLRRDVSALAFELATIPPSDLERRIGATYAGDPVAGERLRAAIAPLLEKQKD